MDFRWQDVGLFYAREVRAALRERSIVINSILVPLLLYPVILWLFFLGFTFARGQEERFVSRLAWSGEARPAALEKALAALEDGKKIEWLASEGREGDRLAILAERLDLAVEAAADPGHPGNLRLSLLFDGSKERSAKARERLAAAAAKYRGVVLEDQAEERGLAASGWQQVHLRQENVSTGKEMGASLLGLIGPMIMVIMISVGTLYPAVDSTAGERERSTWETTFTTAAGKGSILLAKFLYVATFGLIAGLLNLGAMATSLPMVIGPLLGDGEDRPALAIPWAGLPLMFVAAALLALAIAAAMMILAAFARTFKEGQSMVGPVYLASFLPTVLVSSRDIELTAGWALVPVANVVLLARDAINGIYRWPLVGLTLLMQLVLVAACLYLARQVLRFEDVMIGSYGGNFSRFLKERLMRRRPAAAKEPGA